MDSLVISSLDARDDAVELVERKGLGHPDTICDALAETLSRNLCREYRNRSGAVLHHNVDKALLRGGRTAPAFGGGDVVEPISIHLAGRATTEIAGRSIPLREIAVEGSRAWLRDNLHALDPQRHVHVHDLIRPGSQDLQEPFSRQSRQGVALANDTAIGVGYAPLSALERLVLSLENRINGRDRSREHPAWGEDVKVMGVRRGETVSLTVACAMIGRHLAHMDAYLAEKSALTVMAQDLAMECGFPACNVSINAADDPRTNAIYHTVTGTSAEAGDDGQVGRGNRVNGLITPGRPMVLEAAAGKNPVSQVGKSYNVLAREIAETLVAAVPEIASAQCVLASQIGAPITEPAIVHVRVETREGSPIAGLKPMVEDIVAAGLARAPTLVDDFIAGTIDVF
jgi:S-adenosylmethionine synthetase